ncbi:MAG: hypothetical protein RIA72_14845 [Sphingopyxis sp.]|jgi:uncharacterized protein (DUF2384 family)|uniref:hypothetical protein n=1 Tax=Sphingopyxis sp. TaxID=1908224 RepID=UPI0032EE298B
MKDEQFMRVWNDGHDRFSADITRAIDWLTEPFRRLGEYIRPANVPGTDVFFSRCGRRPRRRAQ